MYLKALVLWLVTASVAQAVTFSEGCVKTLEEVQGSATSPQTSAIGRMCTEEIATIGREVRPGLDPKVRMVSVEVGEGLFSLAFTEAGEAILTKFSWVAPEK